MNPEKGPHHTRSAHCTAAADPGPLTSSSASQPVAVGKRGQD